MASGSAERSNQYKTVAITESSVTTNVETFPDEDAFYLMEFDVMGIANVSTSSNATATVYFNTFFEQEEITELKDKGYYKRQPYALHVQAINSFNACFGANKAIVVCTVRPNAGSGLTVDSVRGMGTRSYSSGAKLFRVGVTLIPPYLVDDDGRV